MLIELHSTLQIYVTSSALDGTLQELQAEEGDQETSRQLSACSAWIQEEAEEEDDEEDYLFTQVFMFLGAYDVPSKGLISHIHLYPTPQL